MSTHRVLFFDQKITMEQQTVGLYISDERKGPILVPPQYVTDSIFFNEWMDPYDYVNSVQEAKISMTQLGLAADQLGITERSASKRAQRLTTTKPVSTVPADPSLSMNAPPFQHQSSGLQVERSGPQNTVTLAQNIEALLQRLIRLPLLLLEPLLPCSKCSDKVLDT